MSVAKANLSDPWRRILVDIVWIAIVYATIFVGLFTFMIPVVVLAGLTFYLYFWRAQTPAMYLFKMRVVSVNTGEQAAPLTMLLREVVILVISVVLTPFTFGFSLIVWAGCVAPMFFNEQRQEAWDMLVSTTVVDDPHDSFRKDPGAGGKTAKQALADDLDLTL